MAEKSATSARSRAAKVEETLRHAIAHARNFGERTVMLTMDMAEALRSDAAAVVAELDQAKAKR